MKMIKCDRCGKTSPGGYEMTITKDGLILAEYDICHECKEEILKDFAERNLRRTRVEMTEQGEIFPKEQNDA